MWSDRSPLIAELAREAVQVVDVLLGPHDHLEGWDELAAGCAVPRYTKQPEIHQRTETQEKRHMMLVIPVHSSMCESVLEYTHMCFHCKITF